MATQSRPSQPHAEYAAGATACLRHMSAEGRARAEQFWEVRKTSATASAK